MADRQPILSAVTLALDEMRRRCSAGIDKPDSLDASRGYPRMPTRAQGLATRLARSSPPAATRLNLPFAGAG